MLYNTTLKPNGYDGLPEAQEIRDFNKNGLYRYEHEHRAWEYGLAMKLIKQYNPVSILNVGGGNSPLSMWAANRGIEVTEIDPNVPMRRFPSISYIDANFPTKDLGQFELVLCTSVIEHVEDDANFFSSLLTHAKDLVFLTTDFHPSGRAFSPAHLRTYNAEDLLMMIVAAKIKGFSPIWGFDYSYEQAMVYDYTFAALALVRNV
jgi:2-polyprenyl-3-methyl-5-hydroxy-6-metoxy-1,4-benzoquinol methylase